jgi:6-pyruvoyltetrahydropterin/6-carboxytetrahydropterin synthase
MKIGIISHLDCAHFLPNHPKCGTAHGHTYKVELVVEGSVQDGMILDFADLKQTLQEILQQYDHKSWNDFLEYPSVENICELLHREIGKQLALPRTLRVWEGDGKWAEL